MICRIRAFAHEYGKIFPRGVAKFRAGLASWLADESNGLSAMALKTLRDLVAHEGPDSPDGAKAEENRKIGDRPRFF